MRISFIIIGRNEGWKLSKCIESIFNTITYNYLTDSEVIYVDSKSTDDSIKRVCAYDKVKIFLITGECNAAVARNIGANEAIGDILFFIDGDMEINEEFLSHAINENKLKYEILTGHIDDYLYDMNDNWLGIDKRTYKNKIPNNEKYLKTNGGIFLISKSAWNSVNGMKTKYKRSQDIDFSIRLSKKGYSIVRLPFLICKHHTVEYSNDKRMWQNIKNKYYIYHSLILREHLTTPFVLKRFFRFYYTEFLMLCVILSFLFISDLFPYICFVYFFILVLRTFVYTIKTKLFTNRILYYFERLAYQILHDLLFWYGFLFKNPQETHLKYIKYYK
jgi:glycosyltransferase involved in cell wall biosynthesis